MSKITINGHILISGNLFSGTNGKLNAKWIVSGVGHGHEDVIIPEEPVISINGDYSLQDRDIDVRGGVFVTEEIDCQENKLGYIISREEYDIEKL